MVSQATTVKERQVTGLTLAQRDALIQGLEGLMAEVDSALHRLEVVEDKIACLCEDVEEYTPEEVFPE